MKKSKDTLRGFVLGVLLTAMIAAIPTATALATKRTIDVVYNNIKLVIDGKEVTPLDGAGKPVEPFIYEGTTYLPLRAVSNALTNGEKPVSWDQSTYTVYIGERPVEANKVVDIMDLQEGSFYFKRDDEFRVRQQNYTPFNSCKFPSKSQFLLKENYTELKGFVAIPDTVSTDLSSFRVTARLVISDADTGAVLYQYEIPDRQGEPIPITVDITGVDRLVIDYGAPLKFYNVTLTTISRD